MTTILRATYDSPLGDFVLAADGEALVGGWFTGQKHFGSKLGEMTDDDTAPVFARARRWLDRYFAGDRPEPRELPIRPAGSEFRRAVWGILLRIPVGEVTTYRDIAREVAAGRGLASMSSQAVGGAVGQNPISIIIPCHRVVGADGSLTGYAGGLERKIALLDLEGVDVDGLAQAVGGVTRPLSTERRA
ncbi:MAG: methylated-DNA--[protein]-cysteine S-methyltransferase [Propionibacterium sp.]|nr:methylated-DNA--[protein]-cysteine S-methyltransferase [Propionibacterium sp.]